MTSICLHLCLVVYVCELPSCTQSIVIIAHTLPLQPHKSRYSAILIQPLLAEQTIGPVVRQASDTSSASSWSPIEIISSRGCRFCDRCDQSTATTSPWYSEVWRTSPKFEVKVKNKCGRDLFRDVNKSRPHALSGEDSIDRIEDQGGSSKGIFTHGPLFRSFLWPLFEQELSTPQSYLLSNIPTI